MTRLFSRIMLGLSGLIGGYIGISILFDTQNFFAHNGIEVTGDPGLMSELKAPAIVLLAAAVVLLVGSVKSRFTDMALMIGAIVYGSYGLGRVVSILIDGLPPQPLIAAAVVELVLASILLFLAMHSDTAQYGDAK